MVMTFCGSVMPATVVLSENERALVLQDGRFHDLLKPGRHRLPRLFHTLTVERFNLTNPELVSIYRDALLSERPDLAAAHLTRIETSPTEVAVITRAGRLFTVLEPDKLMALWTDAGPWSVERFDITGTLELPPALARRLTQLHTNAVIRFQVEAGQRGLLLVDHAFVRLLDPGSHSFWNIGRPVQVKIIDIREHALDLNGQEILTKDRVSIRVNLSARYRVVDPVLAVSSVKDFADTLYRALQFAFRRSLGTKTLDELLANKVTVDTEAAETVRSQMAAIGVDVGEIAIKDVILPGEMRDILNRVVQAEKEAEANVIRRREETAATRSLLNTARVMEENPMMLRLKELEALERIAEKVQTLNVHGGTKGLLQDLVSLKGAGDQSERRKK